MCHHPRLPRFFNEHVRLSSVVESADDQVAHTLALNAALQPVGTEIKKPVLAKQRIDRCDELARVACVNVDAGRIGCRCGRLGVWPWCLRRLHSPIVWP